MCDPFLPTRSPSQQRGSCWLALSPLPWALHTSSPLALPHSYSESPSMRRWPLRVQRLSERTSTNCATPSTSRTPLLSQRARPPRQPCSPKPRRRTPRSGVGTAQERNPLAASSGLWPLAVPALPPGASWVPEATSLLLQWLSDCWGDRTLGSSRRLAVVGVGTGQAREHGGYWNLSPPPLVVFL